jgi:glycosyltransferase involved in cell wall biosynthesis
LKTKREALRSRVRIGINALVVTPAQHGGDATYVRQLVAHLPIVGDRDEWVIFVSPSARSLFPSAPANVRYVECQVPTSLVGRALWEQTRLPERIDREHLDVLHAPVNVAPLRVGTPTLLTVHEAEPFTPGNRIPLPLLAWWRLTRTLSARRATRIVTVSQAARAELVHWHNHAPDRVAVVTLGVETQRFYPRPVNDQAVQRMPPYLLWVGRTYPRKNVQRLIEAFARLRHRGRRELLLLAGRAGWGEGAVRRSIARSGCEQAIVRQPLSDEALVQWYRGARAFVFPSLVESFGLPVLEALACGTPVVAGDIPALRETAGDAAVFAEPTSVEALAGAIERVLDNPRLGGQLRSAGLRRAAELGWSETARRTHALYESVARVARRSDHHDEPTAG